MGPPFLQSFCVGLKLDSFYDDIGYKPLSTTPLGEHSTTIAEMTDTGALGNNEEHDNGHVVHDRMRNAPENEAAIESHAVTQIPAEDTSIPIQPDSFKPLVDDQTESINMSSSADELTTNEQIASSTFSKVELDDKEATSMCMEHDGQDEATPSTASQQSIALENQPEITQSANEAVIDGELDRKDEKIESVDGHRQIESATKTSSVVGKNEKVTRSNRSFVLDVINKITMEKEQEMEEDVNRIMQEAEDALQAARMALRTADDSDLSSSGTYADDGDKLIQRRRARIQEMRQRSTGGPNFVDEIRDNLETTRDDLRNVERSTRSFMQSLFSQIKWDS